MVLSWKIVRLELKETFSISYGNYSYRDALIISLTKNEYSGYGECTAIDYYNIDLLKFIDILLRNQSHIQNQTIVHPAKFYDFLLQLQLPSFLRSALDCAYWDLYGKLENKNFLILNNIQYKQLPKSSITISVDTIKNQINKINKSNWQHFKVKLNHFDKKHIESLINLDKSIALDANGSFTQQECSWLENNFFTKQFNYIEQPMKHNQYESLRSNTLVNWMADEDCQEDTNLDTLQHHYSSINIKLVKCGGLTPALLLIKKAKQRGFKIMIGCMTETSIGISAGAVLSPLCDFVDLDGANLIANDIATGSKIVNGSIILSEKAGLGIECSY